MVRSEGELLKYDLLNGSLTVLCLMGALVSYLVERKDSPSSGHLIDLVLDRPSNSVDTDPVLFSGTAPGTSIELINADGAIIAKGTVRKGKWRVKVPAKELLFDKQINVVAKDGTRTLTSLEKPQSFVVLPTLKKLELMPPKIKVPSPGAILGPGELVLVGTGEADVPIKVFVNKVHIETVEPNGKGEWMCRLTLEAGHQKLSVVSDDGQSTIEFDVQ